MIDKKLQVLLRSSRRPINKPRTNLSARNLTGRSIPTLQRLLLSHIDAGFYLPVKLTVGTVIQTSLFIGPDLYDCCRSGGRRVQPE